MPQREAAKKTLVYPDTLSQCKSQPIDLRSFLVAENTSLGTEPTRLRLTKLKEAGISTKPECPVGSPALSKSLTHTNKEDAFASRSIHREGM